MISATYTVHCQRCWKWAGQEETKREALEEAKRCGFRRVKVQNGSMWDFCATCYEIYNDEQKHNAKSAVERA